MFIDTFYVSSIVVYLFFVDNDPELLISSVFNKSVNYSNPNLIETMWTEQFSLPFSITACLSRPVARDPASVPATVSGSSFPAQKCYSGHQIPHHENISLELTVPLQSFNLSELPFSNEKVQPKDL